MSDKIKNQTDAPPSVLPKSRSAPIIERAPLPIVEVQGRDHLVTYVNSAFCDLLEKPRKDLIGKFFSEIVPSGDECIPVLDRVYATGEAATLARKDEADSSHWLFAMWPALDEAECPVGVIIQLTKANQLRQDVSQVNQALIISGLRQHEMRHEVERLNAKLEKEIVERKETGKKLRASEALLKAVLEQLPVGVSLLGLDGQMILRNSIMRQFMPEAMPSFDPERIHRWHAWNSDGSPLEVEQWPGRRALRGESVIPGIEFLFTEKDGRNIWTTIAATPLRNTDGVVTGAVAMVQDINARKQSEIALRQAEENLRLALDAADLGAWHLDSSLKLATDQRFQKIFGMTKEESYETAINVIHPDDRKRVQEAVDAAIRPENPLPYAIEYRVIHPDASIHWVLAKGRASFKNTGTKQELSSFDGTVADVTERKETEEKLRASELETQHARDYAEATLRTAPVPLLVLENDLRISTANDAFYKNFQVSPAETEGVLIYDLGNRQWDMPELRELLEDILPKNNFFNNFEITHDFESIGRRTMLLNARRMENETGQPLRIVLAIEDITDRKLAEDAVRESELRYHNLFDSIDEGFCIIEMIFENEKPVDYRFLEVNPNFGKQSGLHEATGKRMRELAPNHESHWFEVYGKVAQTGQAVRFVNEAKALNRWFDVYAFRIGAPERGRVAVLFRDITERRDTEKALKESREKLDQHAAHLESEVAKRTASLQESIKSLETLTYTMAHDLRAPLRAMSGFSDVLMTDFPMEAEAKTYVDRINVAAKKMDRLVLDLLEYGQLSHQEFSLNPLNLKNQIENSLADAAAEIQAAEARVKVCEPLPMVFGSEPLLHQILSNLILNALKFVPPGVKPEIIFRAEQRGSRIRLWVEDNGVGIDPQYQEKIFGIFQRLYTVEEYPGTGVGLAIVRRAAERMGGTVGVESEPGRGSKFWIELPRSSAS